MPHQPTGTVTFLFTDIEGSTKLWEHYPDQMPAAIKRHDDLLRQAVEAQSGYVFKTVGDACCAAFATAPDALNAALNAQRALRDEAWGETVIKVRMALHTGATDERDGDYFGPPVNRVARLLSAGHGGQILLSSATQELVRDQLTEQVTLRDMGEHRLKDLIRPEHVFQVLAPDLLADFPTLKTLDIHPNNLPAQTTTFIGRESEIAAVEAIIARPDVRLLTLTGPGGTGKTRLSLQVAADLLEQFADGVFFVPLAPISDPALVIPTIVQVLGLQASGSTPPLDVLKNYLYEKQMLLLLDNFEQVLDAAPAITEILTAAPQVNILVTSRTVLRISGEHNYPVPALDLPDLTRELTVRKISQYEAVRLFIERACAAKPDFRVTNANAPAIAEICVRLDGLPLAIELAAARIRLLPSHKMLAQLEHRLKFLTGGGRDVPARQQALRNTIEWSYQLLTEEEKTLFRRLAVFVGGCSLEAIEAVCAGDQEFDLFSGVESLVDKSLLKQVETDAEPRFVMLETIREYALERLSENSEEETIRRQHTQFFLTLAEGVEPYRDTCEQVQCLARLDADYNNLRADLAWSINKDIDICLRLAGALGIFWVKRAYDQEGRDWLAKVLAKTYVPEPEMQEWRAKALYSACQLAWLQGDPGMTRTFGEEMLELWRAMGNQSGIAHALQRLGLNETTHGDHQKARTFLEESIALYRQIGDNKELSNALWKHGWLLSMDHDTEGARVSAEECLSLGQETGNIDAVACAAMILGQIAISQGDYFTAQSFYEKTLKLARELETSPLMSYALSILGVVLDIQGQYDQARTSYTEALEIFQKRGNELWAAWPFSGLGRVALHQRQWQAAQVYFAKSLNIFRKYHDPAGITACLIGLAGIAEGYGQVKQAAHIFGVIHEVRPTITGIFYTEDIAVQREYDRLVAAVRTTLGAEAFAAALAKGRALTLEQAVVLALEGCPENTNKKVDIARR